MPARMRHEFAGIAAALIHRVFAAHFYVPAQRNGGDAVVCVASSETKQARAEADREHFDPNSEAIWPRRNGRTHESGS